MEAHPAHNSRPAKAKLEAMDVLTWAWMGKWLFVLTSSSRPFAQTFTFFSSIERLLPSHSAVPDLPLSLRKNAKN
jgi:hypothetical protein